MADVGAVSFCAERAETEAERQRGLQGREALGPDEALLLPFPVEDDVCIVNANVSFPIDVLFAASDGRVVAIERNVPAGDMMFRCHPMTRDVLETAAGALRDAAVGERLELN